MSNAAPRVFKPSLNSKSNDERVTRRLTRSGTYELLEPHPDVTLMNLEAIDPDDTMSLSLNFFNADVNVYKEARQAHLVDEYLILNVLRNVFNTYKKNSQHVERVSQEGTDTAYAFRVHYVSVSDRTKLAHHHAKRPKKERVFEFDYNDDPLFDGLMEEKERPKRPVPVKMKPVSSDLMKAIAQVFVDHGKGKGRVMTYKDIKKKVRLANPAWRISQTNIDNVLEDVARKVRESAYRSKTTFALRDMWVGELERVPHQPAVRRETPDNILFWADFDDMTFMESKYKSNFFAERAHTMYLSGTVRVGDNEMTFILYLYVNGTVRISLGFRNPMDKDIPPKMIAERTRAIMEHAVALFKWFHTSFMRVNFDNFASIVRVDGISVTGQVNRPYIFEDDFVDDDDDPRAIKFTQRQMLGMYIRKKLQHHLSGFLPVGSLGDIGMDRFFDAWEVGDHDDYVELDDHIKDHARRMKELPSLLKEKFPEHEDINKDPLFELRVPMVMDAYAKQHMDRWTLTFLPMRSRALPEKGFGGVAYEAIEYTTPRLFKFINLTIEDETLPFGKLLWDNGVTPRVKEPIVHMEVIGTSFAEEKKKRVFSLKWTFFDKTRVFTTLHNKSGEDPFKDMHLFKTPVKVTYWWTTGKFSVLTSTNHSDEPWDAHGVVWKLLHHLLTAMGPGNLPPLVDVAQEKRPMGTKANRTTIRGHARYAKRAIAVRKGVQKPGTTCHPSRRIPHPNAFEGVCMNTKTGAPDPMQFVKPTKHGDPCCYQRPETLTTRFKKGVIKAYEIVSQLLPQSVLDMLGLAQQPFETKPEDPEKPMNMTFYFDSKTGRLLINDRLAERLPIATLENIAKRFGYPIAFDDPKRTPIPAPTLIRFIAWNIFWRAWPDDDPDAHPFGTLEEDRIPYYKGMIALLDPSKKSSTVKKDENVLVYLSKLIEIRMNVVKWIRDAMRMHVKKAHADAFPDVAFGQAEPIRDLERDDNIEWEDSDSTTSSTQEGVSLPKDTFVITLPFDDPSQPSTSKQATRPPFDPSQPSTSKALERQTSDERIAQMLQRLELEEEAAATPKRRRAKKAKSPKDADDDELSRLLDMEFGME